MGVLPVLIVWMECPMVHYSLPWRPGSLPGVHLRNGGLRGGAWASRQAHLPSH